MKSPPTLWGSVWENMRKTQLMLYGWLGFGAVTLGKYIDGGYTAKQALWNTGAFAAFLIAIILVVSLVTYLLDDREWVLYRKKCELEQVKETWRTLETGKEFPHLPGNRQCACHLCRTDPSLARLAELGDR